MSNPLDNATKAFWVYAPYYTDPEVQARRASVRPDHLKHILTAYEANLISVGGIIFDPKSTETPLGSAMVLRYKTEAEVRAFLEEDIYWTSNIWDKEKLLVLPYLHFVTSPSS